MPMKGSQVVLALSCSLLAVTAITASAGTDRIMYTPVRGATSGTMFEGMDKSCMTNHGGPVMTSPARLVLIFWGPSFCAGGADHPYATTLQAYRNQLGGTPEWAILQQYGVPVTNLALGTPDLFDCSTPPTNVTDAKVQAKVNSYLATHTFDPNSIYEVVIPSTSYSSSGSSTSCGGPSLAYCAYHSWIGSGVNAKKYTIQPFPSCSGCKVSGWTDAQNQERLVLHETRETTVDPTGTAFWDSSTGAEPDDKCSSPFLVGGYGYQDEWSLASCSCVPF